MPNDLNVNDISLAVNRLLDEAQGITSGGEGELLFSETVTTVAGEYGNHAVFTYSNIIDNDTITVTFNGTDYVCPRIDLFGGHYYGGFTEQGPDFSTYPFAIQSVFMNDIYTENAGTYTVSVYVTA